MRVNDAVSGLIVIVFATLMIVIAQGFPGFPGQNFGPALFPTILGFGLVICGFILVANGLVAHFEAGENWVFPEPTKPNLVSFSLVLTSVVFYILFSDTIGFIISSLTILIVLFASFRIRWAISIPVAFGLTTFIQYFFGNLMRVPLPRGWLDSIL